MSKSKSKSDPQVANVDDLLQTAADDAVFSQPVLDVIKAGDLGAAIGAGLGVTPDDLKASEALLVASIIDNSGSIAFIKRDSKTGLSGPEAVCWGQNLYVNAFRESKQEAGILMGTWLVNYDKPVHPFVSLDNAVLLEHGVNYTAAGHTPLYKTTCTVLATLGLKMEVEYLDAGCPCRGILLIVTDGRNEDYDKRVTAQHCKTLIEDLGESLIVQFMGIESDDTIDYEQIALEMGVQPQHIMTPAATAHDIRASFEFASKSAVSASKSAASFSQTAMQGFTQP